ncbi:hypothetical protein O181_077179 [Austropuccinia psidii MF-1]|uniref:Uncharacterized protein n=1 Tax=Austropuccinia psidii MF-1 TaxID=1389203 RepID=A0A9Q3FDZ9_9BASI|nr:hypothetical protein [Austropuccinia psidii MF-1]
MSFNFTPHPSSLKFKKNASPHSHSQTHSDNFMVRSRPNIEHHEDNDTNKNHRRKLTKSQRKHIYYSKQIMSHLGHSNTSYKDFSTISIDKKAANYSWLKLSSVNTLPHPYVIIDKTKKPFLPVAIYEITPFDHSSGHSQILKDLLMKLMSLSQDQKK